PLPCRGDRRYRAIRARLGQRAAYAGPAHDGDSVGQLDMAGDHAGPPNHAVLAYRGTAGNAGCSTDQRISPDAHVMPDLDEIVDLDTVANDGVIQRAAIAGGIDRKSTRLNSS